MSGFSLSSNIDFVRNPRARRYILRIRSGGQVTVTIPRGGTLEFAQQFAAKHGDWITKQLERAASRPELKKQWEHGTEILLRGEKVVLNVVSEGSETMVRFGSEGFRLKTIPADLRPYVQVYLRRRFDGGLVSRAWELAAHCQLKPRTIQVRNQRTRWGSCSARGAISLNWRLVQTPPFVSDYIILHELMHMLELNHSNRFWDLVERVCPNYRDAERWLKSARLLSH